MSPRFLALTLAVTTATSSLACSKAPPPPVDDTRTTNGSVNDPSAPTAKGMSTGTKVVLLAGAAAAYYMYKKHQNATAANGPESQYYLSKNGRVYYRDADHRAHWVTAPPAGISVPENEAREYQQFQGYNGRTDGKDLAGMGNDSND